MSDISELQKRLETLKKAQKDNEASVMRAEIALEEAKSKVLEATKRLKDLGFTSISQAEAKIAELEQEIQENIDKATEILGV